jgi:disulfide bond formation protein DsbB
MINRDNRDLAFIVALVATGASIYVSNVLGWHVCTLCWLQRVFMYPLVLILGAALWVGAVHTEYAVIPVTTAGLLTSTVHFFTIYLDPTRGCGSFFPCSLDYSLYLGPVPVHPLTLPLGAGVAFGLITLFVLDS